MRGDGSFKSMVVSMQFDSRQQHLLIGRESGAVEIWDAKAARSKREVRAHELRPNRLRFSADGNLFFSNSYFERSTKIWRVATGDLVHEIPGTSGPVCETSTDGPYLVGQDSSVRLFDLKRKVLLPETYPVSGVLLSMAFEPSSRMVAVGTASGTIELWKVVDSNGRPILRKAAAENPYAIGVGVIGLRFSSDGQKLYSVSASAKIEHWDARSLKRLKSLPSSLKGVRAVAFHEGRELVAIAGMQDDAAVRDSVVELIDLPSGALTRFRANSSHPGIGFIPPASALLLAGTLSIVVRPVAGRGR